MLGLRWPGLYKGWMHRPLRLGSTYDLDHDLTDDQVTGLRQRLPRLRSRQLSPGESHSSSRVGWCRCTHVPTLTCPSPAGCARVPEDTTDGKSTKEVDPEPAVSFGSPHHDAARDAARQPHAHHPVTSSSGCWAGRSVLRNRRRLQAAIHRLTRHTREDEDALTDLLNERIRGGWGRGVA